MPSQEFTWTVSKFATIEDAQLFANQRSWGDHKYVVGPEEVDGNLFAVYVAN